MRFVTSSDRRSGPSRNALSVRREVRRFIVARLTVLVPACILLISSVVLAQTSVTVVVPGSADPWLAGMPNGAIATCAPPNLCDRAPGESPVRVPLQLTPGNVLTFEAAGTVRWSPPSEPGAVAIGPDGLQSLVHCVTGQPLNGIPNHCGPSMALVGVFLGPSLPVVFHIGSHRDVTIPSGATELYLGTKDQWVWSNNSGAFTVTVSVSEELPAPSNLHSKQLGFAGDSIQLSWDYGQTAIDHFEVQAKTPSGNWVAIASVPATARTYVDGNVPSFTTVSYRLRASLGQSVSAFSGVSTTFQIQLGSKNCGRSVGAGPCTQSRPWPQGQGFDNTLQALFQPDPFEMSGSLQSLAQESGFDHFNWISTVMYLPPAVNDIQDWHGDVVEAPPPFADPPPGGYLYHLADFLPYYWDEQPGYDPAYSLISNTWPDGRALEFEDHPFSGRLAPLEYTQFVTTLVGVRGAVGAGGSSTALISFVWNTNNRISGASVLANLGAGAPEADASGGILDISIVSPAELPQSVRQALLAAGVDNVATSLKVDRDAPTTTAVIAGPLRATGWYRGAVTVGLIASDIDGPSDISMTSYQLDGAPPASYVEQLGVSGDGIHALLYQSVDRAGNVEEPSKTSVVRIDTTNPLVTCGATPNMLWPPNGHSRTVIVSGITWDMGSGLGSASIGYELTDEYNEVRAAGSSVVDTDGSFSVALSLPAARRGRDKDGRQFELVVKVMDNAGNVGTCTAKVEVPHDSRH